MNVYVEKWLGQDTYLVVTTIRSRVNYALRNLSKETSCLTLFNRNKIHENKIKVKKLTFLQKMIYLSLGDECY